jgi:dimethylargininase
MSSRLAERALPRALFGMAHTERLLAITRDISPAIEHCELTHLERTTIDLSRAQAQHEEYERVLRDLGCEVRRLPTNDSMPDSVFIEDAAIVLDELAVITRPGAESRRAETAAVAEAVRSYRPVAAILAPGTLDGGDVLRVDRRLFVGVGYRSNEAGVKQLRSIVSSQGYTVDAVPFTGCLHLKSAVSLVADDLVLINPAWVDASHFRPLRAIHVDPAEPFAANALLVGDTIIYPAEHVRTRARLEAAGLKVCPVPADELAKAEGGVTCCSLLLTP